MIRLLNSLCVHARLSLVAAFAVMTLWAGASAAQSDLLATMHIAQGERMLPDGGWTSACDTKIEVCAPQPSEIGHSLTALHHHHHADCQFSGLAISSENIIGRAGFAQVAFAPYAAVVKSAPTSAADQPPKA